MFFKRNKPTSNDNDAPSLAAASVVAADMVIDGNVSTGGELQIAGTVRGVVSAAVCIVEHDGLVEGRIYAEDVIVRGRVSGPIHGVNVDLQSGAHVEGDVVNTTISVQTGAHIHGSIWHSDDPLAAENEAAGPRTSAEPAYGHFDTQSWPPARDDGYRPLVAVKPRG